MRCISRLFAIAFVALVFAVPAYSTQYLFEAVTVDSAGAVTGIGMSGPSESPANASPGFGLGTALYDDVAHSLALNATFTGLLGTTSASHIHAPTVNPFLLNASVATTTPSFTGFPLGVTSGAFVSLLDLTQGSSWNPSYVTANGGTTAGAEAAFAAALFANKAYWNIHTSAFPGGEIRGFLTLVPEPASSMLIALGMTGLACIARRRR